MEIWPHCPEERLHVHDIVVIAMFSIIVLEWVELEEDIEHKITCNVFHVLLRIVPIIVVHFMLTPCMTYPGSA